MSNIIKRKPLDFEEYWLMSKAWERRGLPLRAARALVNSGIVTLDDLYRAHDLELATIPGVGKKSLAVLYGLMGREAPRSGRPLGRPRHISHTLQPFGLRE